MVFQDSQKAIEKLYDELDFRPSPNLSTVETPPEDIYQKVLFDSARQKLGIESVFFYRPPTKNISVPHIYFCRLEGRDSAKISAELAKLHKLAWNMGRAPLLFAVLPAGQVLIYNTFTPPTELKPNNDYTTGLIESLNIFTKSEKERRRLLNYHRREFESGRYWQRNFKRFDPRNRADQTLLENLKIMRKDLLDQDIPLKIVHSLLGRAIFVKYLEDRKDSQGNNVFPDKFFEQFSPSAQRFTDILPGKDETYAFFEYLNKKFNGDLFPIDDPEKSIIREEHLGLLKSFLTGKTQFRTKQLGLWKFYSFDAIPIEFISNIYEEFLHAIYEGTRPPKANENGVHYTPHYLVEFLVDEVFPWNGTKTNYKVLDPACGSGIFLVEIYRRLIAHWEQANPDKKLMPEQLKNLAVDNLFGVDIDREAIRVAAFSLYLILCDYLEPRQIWEKVTFPRFRNRNLFPVDFFEDDAGFAEKSYDLIIGNPPWQSTLTPAAERYREDKKGEFPNRQIAPNNQIALAFLWRASELCKEGSEICLLMPSKGLLFNRSGSHKSFRRDFFSTNNIKVIINFSALRHILFKKAAGPGSAIFFSPDAPDETTPILYCSPKPTHSVEDNWQITIEPQDIVQLPYNVASEDDLIWKVAMWGSPRDYHLIKKLTSPPYQTLKKVCDDRKWIHGEGIIVGKEENRKNDASWLLGKPYLDVRKLRRFMVNEENLPQFDIPKLQWPRPRKKDIFRGPHILLKQSPKAGENSFRSALLQKDAVFRDSLVGISGPIEDVNLLAQCCLTLNSRIPLYFALMSSRRWLVERDELNKEEVMNFPMPENIFENPVSYEDLRILATNIDWENVVKHKVEKVYDLNPDEQILIDDAINYTLDYFRLKEKSKAMKPTFTREKGDQFLEQYLQTVKATLDNSFGKQFQMIIFRGESPLRVVALELGSGNYASGQNAIIKKSTLSLEQALVEVDEYLVESRSNVFIQRVMRAYLNDRIYIIKPDQRRYWTRARALQDADEIYADIMEVWRA